MTPLDGVGPGREHLDAQVRDPLPLRGETGPGLPRLGAEVGGKELEEAARAFESIFVQTLLKSMRSTIQKSELFDAGQGGEIFTGMMDQHFAEAAAGRGRGIGLAKMIVAQYGRHARAAEGPGAALDLRADGLTR